MGFGTAVLLVAIIAAGYVLAQRTIPSKPLPSKQLPLGVMQIATPTGFDALDKASAAAVGSTDPKLIADMTENVAVGTGFALSARNKQRLAQAEIDFRSGVRRGLTTAEISAGFNRFVSNLPGPSYLHTNERQIGMMAEMLARSVPHVLVTSGAPTDVRPIGSVLITLVLLRQKLSAPDGKLPPDEWVRATRERQLSQSPQSPATYRLGGREVPPDEMVLSSKLAAAILEGQGEQGLLASLGL